MNWNPSEGIAIGPLTLHYYSITWVIAFMFGWYVMRPIFKRENQSMENLDSLFVYTFLATLLGARLGHVFFYDWEYFRNNLLEILLPVKFEPTLHFTGFTGLASHGAAVGIILTMYFYSKNVVKKPILWILDLIVIPVASGAIFIRIGNFFNSEIYGNITDKSNPIGVKFVQEEEFWNQAGNNLYELTNLKDRSEAIKMVSSDPKFSSLIDSIPYRYPAQLMEAFCYIFVFAILLFMYWKTDARNKSGLIFGSFLVLLFGVRFVVEYYKMSQGGVGDTVSGLSTGQWLSIPFVLVGLYFVFRPKKSLEV